MKQMHPSGAAHHHIANAGNNKGRNMVFHAIFNNFISVMAVNSGKKNSLHSFQLIQIRYAFGCLTVADHLKFFRKSVFLYQVCHSLPHIPDNKGTLGSECFKIPPMGGIGP